MTTSLSSSDRRFATIESALAALGAGCLVYGVSCLIVPPGNEAHGFGIDWQSMSEQPFALVGSLPHRMLAPLLAHVLGMGGGNWVLFVRGLTIVLLATVWFFCR